MYRYGNTRNLITWLGSRAWVTLNSRAPKPWVVGRRRKLPRPELPVSLPGGASRSLGGSSSKSGAMPADITAIDLGGSLQLSDRSGDLSQPRSSKAKAADNTEDKMLDIEQGVGDQHRPSAAGNIRGKAGKAKSLVNLIRRNSNANSGSVARSSGVRSAPDQLQYPLSVGSEETDTNLQKQTQLAAADRTLNLPLFGAPALFNKLASSFLGKSSPPAGDEEEGEEWCAEDSTDTDSQNKDDVDVAAAKHVVSAFAAANADPELASLGRTPSVGFVAAAGGQYKTRSFPAAPDSGTCSACSPNYQAGLGVHSYTEGIVDDDVCPVKPPSSSSAAPASVYSSFAVDNHSHASPSAFSDASQQPPPGSSSQHVQAKQPPEGGISELLSRVDTCPPPADTAATMSHALSAPHALMSLPAKQKEPTSLLASFLSSSKDKGSDDDSALQERHVLSMGVRRTSLPSPTFVGDNVALVPNVVHLPALKELQGEGDEDYEDDDDYYAQPGPDQLPQDDDLEHDIDLEEFGIHDLGVPGAY